VRSKSWLFSSGCLLNLVDLFLVHQVSNGMFAWNVPMVHE
jgi:hypothetical protein